MATRKFDFFKDLRKGKYDWKVQARVLNLWRGYTKKGEPFKAFNLLLLDTKRGRIHAFVPGAVAEDIEKQVELGVIYLIQNFTVKDYKVEDKFRCIRKEIQIVFGSDTTLKPLAENDVSIERCWFDFYDLEDLKQLAKQNTYLTDVIGVMEEHDPIEKVRNKHGEIQSQIKFSITDGSVKVTFWDDFAELFADTIGRDLDHPVIIIIGSCRVTIWDEEVILANVGATTFYLNYDHYSVTQLRKRLAGPEFKNRNLSKPKYQTPMLYSVKDLKNLDRNDDEVRIMFIQQIRTWCHPICTSCYQKIGNEQNVCMCSACNRVVPYPDMRFELQTRGSDQTGEIQIILQDREIRTLVGKTALELLAEGNNEDNWPQVLQTLENKDYTVKLKFLQDKLGEEQNYYVATNIMEGFDLQVLKQEVEESHPHPISYTEAQAYTKAIILWGNRLLGPVTIWDPSLANWNAANAYYNTKSSSYSRNPMLLS